MFQDPPIFDHPYSSYEISRQQEIAEELASKYNVEHYWVHFTNDKSKIKEADIIYSEFIKSVGCTLHFWINPRGIADEKL